MYIEIFVILACMLNLYCVTYGTKATGDWTFSWRHINVSYQLKKTWYY